MYILPFYLTDILFWRLPAIYSDILSELGTARPRTPRLIESRDPHLAGETYSISHNSP